MTVVWQWSQAVFLTLGMIELGIMAGIPIGFRLSKRPVPDERPKDGGDEL